MNPESDAPAPRLPTVLLTGFLGAGKTTFLNHLLDELRRRPERVCLIINEFGREGIDASLLSPGPETIHEVNAGSIFCVCTRDQFLAALDAAAAARPPFDLLVVEATGIAATSDLGAYIYGPPLNGRIAVTQNICLVDAANFHKVRATLPAATNQVEEAGVLILNKADLVSAARLAQLRGELRTLNPRAPVHACSYGAVPLAEVLGDYAPGSEWRSRQGLASVPPASVVSASLTAEGTLDPERLEAFLASLPTTLLRGKGTLRLPEGAVYAEWVLGAWARRPYRGTMGAASRLVLIGPELEEEALQARFAACTAGPSAGPPPPS
jgi:G3E family GTPase